MPCHAMQCGTAVAPAAVTSVTSAASLSFVSPLQVDRSTRHRQKSSRRRPDSATGSSDEENGIASDGHEAS